MLKFYFSSDSATVLKILKNAEGKSQSKPNKLKLHHRGGLRYLNCNKAKQNVQKHVKPETQNF